jgi:hypothetical protein
MTDSQEGEKEHEGSRPETHPPACPPRVAKLPERSYQQPIAALEYDRCSRDCDRRQRIPLRLELQRWGLPHALLSRSHRQHATSRQRRHRTLPPISVEELHEDGRGVNPSVPSGRVRLGRDG